MTVLDIGCGPGFFSVPLAQMVGPSGKVIAADLQDGMLQILQAKTQGTVLEPRIKLHKCKEDKIGVAEKVDLVLAFYMVHEVPSKVAFLREIKSILSLDGNLFIIEPKLFVSKKEFADMVNTIRSVGFDIVEKPRVFFSRAIILRNRA
jgi:ubiquinone/menaquinone biosynthesis C-methylase UbiE